MSNNDGRKKLSGHQYKKRRLEKEADRQKQTKALFRYLQTSQNKSVDLAASGSNTEVPNKPALTENDTSPPLPLSLIESDTSLPLPLPLIESDARPPQTLSGSDTILPLQSADMSKLMEKDFQSIYSDPALWPYGIDDVIKTLLVTQGPSPPLYKHKFPLNDQGRRFSTNQYTRTLSNGEQILRNWLIYSTSKDCVYCFCCKIFGSKVSSLAKDGYKNWKHLGVVLKEHETASTHIQAQKSWLEFAQRLKCNKTIDAAAQRLINVETNHWFEVILRIVAIVKIMAKSCLAFQGTSNKLFEYNNGNFLKIVELLSQFDPIMEEHVRRILKKEETRAHYLGKNIQNEIIDLLYKSVKSHILSEITSAKYYAIILDCTPDISKTEQLTMIIRYVSIKTDAGIVDIKVNESFLGFLPVERATGKHLLEIVTGELSELGINLQDMRGQGYDNGSNMKGGKEGLQSRIKSLNSRAFYVPCSSHSLNLVVNDMAKASLEAANFFNIVQKIWVFFATSTYRWGILLNYVQGLTLKPLSDTRWESRIEALKPLRFSLGDVYDALLSIYENPEVDPSARAEGSGLLSCIKQFKFVCSIVIWFKILNCINPISKLMQAKDFDLSSVLVLLQNCQKFFDNLRSDSGFNDILIDARELANEIDIEANFESTLPRHRVRTKKRQFSYEAKDDPITDPKEKYKIDFFFFTIDQAINALGKRFAQLNHHNTYFEFLYNIHDLKNMSKETLVKHCKNLESVLTENKSADVNGLELVEEISVVSALLDKKESVINVLKLITSLNCAPNLSIALRILLTIPISVASGERSFSKLKLIKNYLRSTCTENRLNGLAVLAIEHEIVDQMDLKDTVRKFAELKVRKKCFL